MMEARTYIVTILWLDRRGQISKREETQVTSHGDAEAVRQWYQLMYKTAHSVSVQLAPEKSTNRR